MNGQLNYVQFRDKITRQCRYTIAETTKTPQT